MEYEVVSIRVPKGFVRDGFHLVVDQILEGDLLVEYCHFKDASHCRESGLPLRLLLRPDNTAAAQRLKPAWNPPKLKKGWLTWDITGGWWWWSGRPYHTGKFEGWVHSESRCGDGGEQIGEVMADLLGCPDCSGFDERGCIWEVGE